LPQDKHKQLSVKKAERSLKGLRQDFIITS